LQDLVQRLVNSRGNRYLLDLLQEDEGILSDTITATATAATTATEDDSDYEPSNSTTNITSSDSYDTESSKDSENANHFDQINFSDSDNDNESDWTDLDENDSSGDDTSSSGDSSNNSDSDLNSFYNHIEDNSDSEESRDDEDDNISQMELQRGLVKVHERIDSDCRNVPPIDNIEVLRVDACDCLATNLLYCCRDDEYEFFGYQQGIHKMDFMEIEDMAYANRNNFLVDPNNLQRKALYRRVYWLLDFYAEYHPDTKRLVRKKLPSCIMARIRKIYPSRSGYYMGFKETE